MNTRYTSSQQNAIIQLLQAIHHTPQQVSHVIDKYNLELSQSGWLDFAQKSLSSSSSKRNNAFITINFRPGIDPEVPVRLLSNILNKKWIPSKYAYVHEQRGETIEDIGIGHHVHLLLESVDKPKSHIHREIYNTVKNHVGCRLHVDVRMIPSDWLEDKYSYINGTKWEPEKSSKIEIDKLWREKFPFLCSS